MNCKLPIEKYIKIKIIKKTSDILSGVKINFCFLYSFFAEATLITLLLNLLYYIIFYFILFYYHFAFCHHSTIATALTGQPSIAIFKGIHEK